MSPVRSYRIVSCGIILSLAACAQVPQPPPKPTGPSETAAISKIVSTTDREKLAQSWTAQGRLADALTQWKILRAIDPDNPMYERQESKLDELIKSKAADYVRAGTAAQAKDDKQSARARFLAALAIDPSNTDALEELRRLEFDRVWRVQVAKLDKLKESAGRTSASASEQERFYFELAALMFRQGDYSGTVREMQKYLNSYPGDAQAKKLMADAYAKLAASQREQGQLQGALSSLEQARRFGGDAAPVKKKDETEMRNALANEYYEKGLRLQRTDLAQAIELYEKALEYNPNHTKAQTKLRDAKRMQKNLESIGK